MGCSKISSIVNVCYICFAEAGIDAVHEEADFRDGSVIINTCGFIGDAKEESIAAILVRAGARPKVLLIRCMWMGCLE